MKVSNHCSHCLSSAKSVQRDISAQTWSALIHWNEVEPEVIDKPLCNQCHRDIRDLLIERSAEFAAYIEAQSQPATIKLPTKREAPDAAAMEKSVRRVHSRKAIA